MFEGGNVKQIPNKILQMLGMLSILALTLTACMADPDKGGGFVMQGADARRGAEALGTYGCGGCHTIPGITNAEATVGPPLDDWAERHFIAGTLNNTPENLVFWIRFPQSVEPRTAMPNLGVDEASARDMAAYLFNLPERPSQQPWWDVLNLVPGQDPPP